METSKLNDYIDIYNLGAFCSSQIVEYNLSDTVVLANIWMKPPIEAQDATGSERFFFIIEKKEAIGIVLDMGIHDIHWLMKPSWRKKGKLSNALKNIIFPYLFNNECYEYLESSFDSEVNEKYLLKLGFESSVQKGKVKLHREKVFNSKIKPIVNEPSLVDVELMRKDIAIAANLIASISDRVKSYGEVCLYDNLFETAEYLHETASHQIADLKTYS